MLASLFPMNQNDLLVGSSRLLALSAAEEAEEAEEAGEAEEVEGAEEVMILTTTPTPSLPKPRMGSSMGKNQQYSQETER